MWTGTAWENSTRAFRTYEDGFATEITLQIWDVSAWASSSRNLFTYEDGLLTERVIQDWDGSAWVNNVRIRSTYGNSTAAEDGPTTPRARLSAYPTPPRGALTVALEMPMAGALRLAVYDLLGRRVAEQPERTLPAGAHELPLDLSALPTGVYVVRASGAVEATQRTTVTR